METLLIIFELSVRSSYSKNTEIEATENEFDTVQFYTDGSTCWRIRTFALDQDVHVHDIGKRDDLLELARTNTEKHYGDVLVAGYVLRSSTGLDGIRAELVDRGLDDNLETQPSALAFWAPIGTMYRSRTRPVDD